MMNRRELMKRCGAAAAAAVAAEAAAAPRPNIVTILFDDMGYGDCSCYGNPTIITPNIDRMAQEGVRFTQFAGSPLCAPSRGQLLTGRLGVRTGLTTNFFPWSEGGIPGYEITIAQMLKKAGYATMCVGKWHLGHLQQYLPMQHGFDDYFGIPYSNDMSPATNHAEWARKCPPTPLIRGNKVIEQEPDQSLLTQRYTEMATDFIRKSARAGTPFFLYLPHTMPHQPVAASSRFRGKSAYGLYGDVVQELDWSVGEVLRVLRDEKVDRNTLVVLSSDNGAAAGIATGPFRGSKGTTWEGGMREPGIAWWPGRVPAGITTTSFASNMDLFPTYMKLAGLEMPADRVYDGHDLSPVLFQNDPGREALFFYYRNSPGGPYDRPERLQAVRKGRWKLHIAPSAETCCALDGQIPPRASGEPALPWLFDVQGDISERRHLENRYPEVVKELLALIKEHESSFRPAPTQE